MRARARADAALLFSPTAHAQAIRFPENNQQDTGEVAGEEFQARLALSASPLDMVRGKRLIDAAEADCARAEAADDLLALVIQGPDQVRAVALRRQLESLDSHESDARALLERGQQRFRAQVINLAELHELSAAHADFERKRVEVRGELGRTEAELPPAQGQDLDQLKDTFVTASMRLEHDLARVRALEPWRVSVRGGLVAEAPLDYFGMIEVSYNLGGFAHHARDADYVRARRRELSESRTELSHQSDVLARKLSATREQAAGERAVAQGQLEVLRSARTTLEQSDVPSAPHLLSLLVLREMVLGAEVLYLTTLAQELGQP